MEYLIELLTFRGFRQQPISSKYKVHTLKLTPAEDRAFIWGKWYIIITSRWKNHKLCSTHLIRKWKWLIGLDKENLALLTVQRGYGGKIKKKSLFHRSLMDAYGTWPVPVEATVKAGMKEKGGFSL